MKILATFETRRAPATAPGRVVLIDKGEGAHPLVTWWENTESGGYCWGHYFTREQRAEAESDFRERCARGY